MTRTHQIGEVAEALGLSLRTIRHYEEVGLVVPSGRSAGGFRLYTDPDIERLRLVMQMKPLDLSLEEIHELVDLLGEVEGPRPSQQAITRLADFVTVTGERRDRMRDRLAQATRLTDRLAAAVEHASQR